MEKLNMIDKLKNGKNKIKIIKYKLKNLNKKF